MPIVHIVHKFSFSIHNNDTDFVYCAVQFASILHNR